MGKYALIWIRNWEIHHRNGTRLSPLPRGRARRRGNTASPRDSASVSCEMFMVVPWFKMFYRPKCISPYLFSFSWFGGQVVLPTEGAIDDTLRGHDNEAAGVGKKRDTTQFWSLTQWYPKCTVTIGYCDKLYIVPVLSLTYSYWSSTTVKCPRLSP